MGTSSRFRSIFWGTLFAFLSIRIDNVDILPDVPGYVLLVIGCSGFSGGFAVARWLWAVLAVLSVVPDWFLGARSEQFGYLIQAMQCGGLWFLLGGMTALATARQRPKLARSLTRRRVTYVGLSVFIALYPRLLANPLNDTSGAVVVVASIAMLLTVLMVLHIILRAGREIAANDSEEPRAANEAPPLAMLTILAAGGLGIFFFSQHTYSSTTFCGANFHARTPQDCTVVDADLMNLLQAKGFSGNYQPTQMDQFAGLHSSDSRDTWLKSDGEEFKGIYLNVSKSPQAISISTKWEHDGFKSGQIRTKRKAYELALELARWFHARPEMMKVSPEFDDAGIKNFEQSLAELPPE